jgi:hypothetical protein
MENRQTITEAGILERLKEGRLEFPPLSLRLLGIESGAGTDDRLDAVVEVRWSGVRQKFAVETKALSTPKAFQDVVNRVKAAALPKDCRAMIILPYLREEQLRTLEREGISGIDLCGNGVVQVTGKLAVYRTGAPNRFPLSAPIKNVYQKNSSMVGRVFLARPQFASVQEIRDEINRRNPLVQRGEMTAMSLATVSKALKTLDQDLIVSRAEQIRLLQADALLERLTANYTAPKVRARVRLKIAAAGMSLPEWLQKESAGWGLVVVASGLSSVAQYAVMQRGELVSVYCSRAETLLAKLPGSPTDRFPNLEIIETEDETAYFDARGAGGFRWASPVQVYLELMAGDKRDQETAVQVRELLLKPLSGSAS